MPKTLSQLKNGRSSHGDRFEYKGREVTFHGETQKISAHYKLHPTNLHGTTHSKKRAIKFLEKGF